MDQIKKNNCAHFETYKAPLFLQIKVNKEGLYSLAKACLWLRLE